MAGNLHTPFKLTDFESPFSGPFGSDSNYLGECRVLSDARYVTVSYEPYSIECFGRGALISIRVYERGVLTGVLWIQGDTLLRLMKMGRVKVDDRHFSRRAQPDGTSILSMRRYHDTESVTLLPDELTLLCDEMALLPEAHDDRNH